MREKLDVYNLHKKASEKWRKMHKKALKTAEISLAVHTGVQGGVQNDKRRRGYCAVYTAAGEVKRWLLQF